jgi:uncharacterized protein YukE
MADVTARLAQGLPAVENAGTYADACRRLGYHSLSDASLREWYGTEDGMDLTALQDDSAALGMAAATVEDAARRQAELTTRLAGAWSGTGASAAQDFLIHQNDAAAAVRDGLVTAAAALATLRDDLWRAVDTKVNAALDIDERPSALRGEWLAAAHTVTTGAGDVPTASELVDQQVKPFVDNDIGAELLSEMRAGFDRVTAAFDAAIERLDASPAARFDVPGESGTPWQAAPTGSPGQVPSPVSPAATPPPGEMGGGMPSLGGGMPSLGGLGGGLSGFGQQLADLIGGLTGSADALPEPEALTELDDLSEPDVTKPDEDEPEDEDDAADMPDDAAVDDSEPADADEIGSGEADPVEEPAPDLASEPAPEPLSVPQPVAPPPPQPTAFDPEALPAEQTPCEIAAEELPRVGE